jgi:hypothetical protein
VSRVWRTVKSDWDTWNARSLADEAPGLDPGVVRLILDGTVVRVRLDRKATSIALVIGQRSAPISPMRFARHRAALRHVGRLTAWLGISDWRRRSDCLPGLPHRRQQGLAERRKRAADAHSLNHAGNIPTASRSI